MAKKIDPHARADAVAEKMAHQLRVRGEHLPEVAARVGRKVPKKLAKDLELILQADRIADNPKLARQIDDRKLAKAQARLMAWLDSHDPEAERWAEIQDMVAKVAFVVLGSVIAIFAFAVWRGIL